MLRCGQWMPPQCTVGKPRCSVGHLPCMLFPASDRIMRAQLCHNLSMCILSRCFHDFLHHLLSHLWVPSYQELPVQGLTSLLLLEFVFRHIFKFWCFAPAHPCPQSRRAWGRIGDVSSLQEQEFWVNPRQWPHATMSVGQFLTKYLKFRAVIRSLFCLSFHHPAKQARASLLSSPCPWCLLESVT